jgi:hypothetical protein
VNQQNSKRRSAGTTAVKALIGAGAVAATLAGWALLPSNDPPATAAAAQPDQPPAFSVPGNGLDGSAPGVQTAPNQGQQDPTAPSFVPPSNGFTRQPRSFTRSHSSR